MNRLARLLVPFAVAATLSGCGIKESFEKVDGEIAGFHRDLDADKLTHIWTTADPEMRKAVQRAEFDRLLSAVHTKLGKVKQTKQVGWNTNATTGGTYLTATMQTTFEKGSGTEQFVYRKGKDDALTLVRYNIDSRDMMLN